jgi:NAD-dependent deacetylase
MSSAAAATDPLRRAARWISQAGSICVLTGAGVSAESGVPTFRDAQSGLWARYDPETLASPEGFASDPGLVWRWYMSRFGGVRDARPNAGHHAIAHLQAFITHRGETGARRTALPGRFTLVTQNVDDLHERAGSTAVLHLHGSIHAFRCSECDEPHDLLEEDRALPAPPACAKCGGFVRPGVVWFGENLPAGIFESALRAAESSDIMLVVGTSGVVHPAALLPRAAKSAGATVIDVNPQAGPVTEIADIFLEGPGGDVLPRLIASLGEPGGP